MEERSSAKPAITSEALDGGALSSDSEDEFFTSHDVTKPNVVIKREPDVQDLVPDDTTIGSPDKEETEQTLLPKDMDEDFKKVQDDGIPLTNYKKKEKHQNLTVLVH
jgi:hypothetical protein